MCPLIVLSATLLFSVSLRSATRIRNETYHSHPVEGRVSVLCVDTLIVLSAPLPFLCPCVATLSHPYPKRDTSLSTYPAPILFLSPSRGAVLL